MGGRGLALAAVLGVILAWATIRRPVWTSRLLGELPADLRCGLQVGAIRWSGRLLHSMGAVESAPRAELDALLAQRVACALAERLKAGAADLKVLVIGRVVHLEGTVGSAEERAEAHRLALEVSGAQVIADDLQVARSGRPQP